MSNGTLQLVSGVYDATALSKGKSMHEASKVHKKRVLTKTEQDELVKVVNPMLSSKGDEVLSTQPDEPSVKDENDSHQGGEKHT